jgi:hypothetical protein
VILQKKTKHLILKIYSLQIYPSSTHQGGGKKSQVLHPPFGGNNWYLGAFGKIQCGQLGWWNVKFHHSSSIL